MQTIGETTDKMDFPLTWTDILLKSISGKTNYTIDVKIGTKRISTDNQDPREIPKKRRKQSNPTRISSNEKNDVSGLGSELLLPTEKIPNQLNPALSVNDLQLTTNKNPPTSLPLNLIKCDNQKQPSNESIKLHLFNNIQQQNDVSTEAAQNSSSSYQSSMKSVQYFEKNDINSVESSASTMLSFKHQPIGSATNVGLSTVQIFNPEAFCDQCNKEFCNKYFLKTHKANKHGVFMDGQLNTSVSDQLDRIKLATLSATNADYSLKTNDVVATGPSTSSLFRSPVQFTQPAVLNANSYVSKNMINNNQTRAFCNICHKEFCNKYFVKRHKFKIHGIMDEEDCRTTTDDVPFNFKTSLQIKNEFLDIGNSDTCDKDKKPEPHSFPVHEPTSELSKTRVKLCTSDTQTSMDDDEFVTKSILTETSCDNIKVEPSDDELQNDNYANKLPDGSSNTINYCNDSELTNSVTDVMNTNVVEHSAVVQNELFRPNVEIVVTPQPAGFRSNTNTAVNTVMITGEYGVSANNCSSSAGTKTNEFNNSKVIDYAKSVENGRGLEQQNDGETTKNKSVVSSRNLFFALNGYGRDNVCHVCNARVDGSLKAHIFDKHEQLVHELMANDSQPERGDMSCHECQQTFGSEGALRAHVERFECGGGRVTGRASASSKNSAENDDCSSVVTNKTNWTWRDASSDRYKSQSTAAAAAASQLSSFCKICNKELCNKYFMKTHMQRMHGISIENGNHIGGVVCDVCNKELCSKYFLRVHKQNSHGIVEYGGGGGGLSTCQKHCSPAADSTTENNGQMADSAVEPDTNRYYKHYTEVCSVCLRRFRSAKWLSAHLLNDHHGDEAGKTQLKHVQSRLLLLQQQEDETCNNKLPQQLLSSPGCSPRPASHVAGVADRGEDVPKRYRCSYCSFATSVLSFLFVHEKFHLADTTAATGTTAATENASSSCPPSTIVHEAPQKSDDNRLLPRFDFCNQKPAVDSGSTPPCTSSTVVTVNGDSTCKDAANTGRTDMMAITADSPGPSSIGRTENDKDRRRRSTPESNHEPFIMQSFFLENCSVSPTVKAELSGRSDSFHSSLVYLPVKEKLTSTVNVFFKLTPT